MGVEQREVPQSALHALLLKGLDDDGGKGLVCALLGQPEQRLGVELHQGVQLHVHRVEARRAVGVYHHHGVEHTGHLERHVEQLAEPVQRGVAVLLRLDLDAQHRGVEVAQLPLHVEAHVAVGVHCKEAVGLEQGHAHHVHGLAEVAPHHVLVQLGHQVGSNQPFRAAEKERVQQLGALLDRARGLGPARKQARAIRHGQHALDVQLELGRRGLHALHGDLDMHHIEDVQVLGLLLKHLEQLVAEDAHREDHAWRNGGILLRALVLVVAPSLFSYG